MIILTGASGGIGKQIISGLLKFDNVIGLYNKTKLKSCSNKKLICEKVNIGNSEEIKAFVKKYKKKLSRVTLIHAAASKIDGLAASYSESDWDSVMGVNLKGNFLLSQALLPYMIQERWGRIIHISSLGGIQGSAGTIAYSTSKTGLIGMSRVLAKEYARFNITSNILVLGYFETGLFKALKASEKKQIMDRLPSKTFGKVNNIANAIEFLINSDYVNGASINIDGGI